MTFLICQHTDTETNVTQGQYFVNFQKAAKTIRLIISPSHLEDANIFLLSQRGPYKKHRAQSEAIACSHILTEASNLTQTFASSWWLRCVR